MNFDDEICLCYHVSLRKLVHFARRTRPKHPSQMTECLGAGTGCGWCIPILCKIARAATEETPFGLGTTPDEYAAERAKYREENRPRNQFGPADVPPHPATEPEVESNI